ncbi:hypothetical protein WG904_10130 [Pedobacter sp. Du54]|uniref:hypothetical protein n=1 Tax=Pedobacter anseongensis TaxID=3133439 RepID=UPI0030A545B7
MFKKIVFILFLLASIFATVPKAQAQCSMCTINAEQGSKNGNTQSKGINQGVIYLLIFPYILIAGVGILWYRNYRKKITAESISS